MFIYALLLQRRAGYVDLAVRSAVQCTLLSEPRSDEATDCDADEDPPCKAASALRTRSLRRGQNSDGVDHRRPQWRTSNCTRVQLWLMAMPAAKWLAGCGAPGPLPDRCQAPCLRGVQRAGDRFRGGHCGTRRIPTDSKPAPQLVSWPGATYERAH